MKVPPTLLPFEVDDQRPATIAPSTGVGLAPVPAGDAEHPVVRRPESYHAHAVDVDALLASFPAAGDYFELVWPRSRQWIEDCQERRFLHQVALAWHRPFYQRLWGAHGIEPGDITGLSDLPSLPIFSVEDLRLDMDEHPPFGTYQAAEELRRAGKSGRLVTSGGTTGTPRPMFFSNWDREVASVLGSRVLHAHGIRPGMVAQVVNGLSTVTGGIFQMECAWKYNGAIPLTTGGGNSTPTDMQIEMAVRYRSDAILGFPDYIRRIGRRAQELGIEPARDMVVRRISTNLGQQDRRVLEELFGATVRDAYGTSEIGGYLAFEVDDTTGRYVMEDAYVVEHLVDGQPVAPGTAANPVVTTLWKSSAPMIRYNTQDLIAELDGSSPYDTNLRRLGPFLGRSDDLVKVKGMWLHPEEVGRIVGADPRSNGEFLCVVEIDAADPRGDSKRLRVLVEVPQPDPAFVDDLRHTLKVRLGVTLDIEMHAPGRLEPLVRSESNRSGKARRLIDVTADPDAARSIPPRKDFS